MVVWLNYYGHALIVLYPYYVDFKAIILSGFDSSQGILASPSFPMWGYGWLLLITENKIALLCLQIILGLLSVWFFLSQVEKNRILPERAIFLLKILLFVSVPWYAFHSIRWPNSIAVSLVILSFAFLLKAFSGKEKPVFSWFLISALFFGLALNFRSDYCIYPIAVAALFLLFKKAHHFKPQHILLWLFTTYIMLIPWGIYTYHATEHFLLTSTNAGHALFISLGNLPDNKWGITKWDQDVELHEAVFTHFQERQFTCTYEVDKFLKREFLKKIKNDPREYFRKVFYVMKDILISGVYPGEFHHEERLKVQPVSTSWAVAGETWEWEDFEENKYEGIGKMIWSDPFHVFSYVPPVDLARIIIKKFSILLARVVLPLSVLFLPFTLLMAWKERNYLLILIILLILFQIMVNVFIYNWNLYMTNVYLFLLVNLSYGSSLLYNIYSRHYFKRNFEDR